MNIVVAFSTLCLSVVFWDILYFWVSFDFLLRSEYIAALYLFAFAFLGGYNFYL